MQQLPSQSMRRLPGPKLELPDVHAAVVRLLGSTATFPTNCHSSLDRPHSSPRNLQLLMISHRIRIEREGTGPRRLRCALKVASVCSPGQHKWANEPKPWPLLTPPPTVRAALAPDFHHSAPQRPSLPSAVHRRETRPRPALLPHSVPARV